MDCPQSYHPTIILSDLGHRLFQHDENLRVQLSSNKVTCEEALSAVLECVASLPVRTYLPTRDPLEHDPLLREARRREAIRQHARFSRTMPIFPDYRILDKEKITNAEGTSLGSSAPLGLPIRSNVELKPTDLPEPITPEERVILKKQALEMNLPPNPYPHLLPDKGKDGRLPDGTDDVKDSKF